MLRKHLRGPCVCTSAFETSPMASVRRVTQLGLQRGVSVTSALVSYRSSKNTDELRARLSQLILREHPCSDTGTSDTAGRQPREMLNWNNIRPTQRPTTMTQLGIRWICTETGPKIRIWTATDPKIMNKHFR